MTIGLFHSVIAQKTSRIMLEGILAIFVAVVVVVWGGEMDV